MQSASSFPDHAGRRYKRAMNPTLNDYHLITRFRQQISDRAEQTAFREWSPAREFALTWRELGKKVDALSDVLLQEQVGIQERISICGNNSRAWAIADLAILQLLAVTLPSSEWRRVGNECRSRWSPYH